MNEAIDSHAELTMSNGTNETLARGECYMDLTMAPDGVAGDVSHVSNNSYEPGSDGNGVRTASDG